MAPLIFFFFQTEPTVGNCMPTDAIELLNRQICFLSFFLFLVKIGGLPSSYSNEKTKTASSLLGALRVRLPPLLHTIQFC